MSSPRALVALLLLIGIVPALGCKLVSQYRPHSISTYRGRHFSQEGASAKQEGKIDEAAAAFAKAVELCPDDPEMREEYADILSQQGKTREAVDEFERAVRLQDPPDASLYVKIAEKRLELGQTDYAFAAVEHAIAIDPKLPEAWRLRGESLRRLQLPDEALADLHKALSLKPGDEETSILAAEVYLEMGKADRALVALQRLGNRWTEEQEPQRILYLKGLAHMRLGRHEDAALALAKAADRAPPTAELLYNLGQAELLAGSAERAARAVNDALAIDPRHGPSRRLLERIGARPVRPNNALR